MKLGIYLAIPLIYLTPGYGAVAGVTFSRTFGSATVINAAAVDAAGNLYLAGSTEDANFPVTPGAAQTKFGGGACVSYNSGPLFPTYYPCDDIIVVKLDPDGNVLFATFLGGAGADVAYAIGVDPGGSVYVAGTTAPSSRNVPNNFPTTAGAAFPLNAQSALLSQGFVAKLNPGGTALTYSTLIPAGVAGLAVDAHGLAYFEGTDVDGTFPATPGVLQTSSAGTSDTVVGELNAAGSALVYGTYLGGSGAEYAGGIAIDGQGNAYVTGQTWSTDFPATAGSYLTTRPSANLYSVFVAKLNPAGTDLIYATYLGGANSDLGTAIRVDGQGSAYVLGQAFSADFPVTPGAFQAGISQAPWLPGSSSNFLAKLNSSGSALAYSTFLSGAVALDTDAAGNAYVTGQAGRGFPVTTGALQRCSAGGAQDLFVAQFDTQGRLAAATYLGGAGTDSPRAIALTPNGSLAVAGTTTSLDFSAVHTTLLDSPVAFAAKIQIANPDRKDAPCMALALQNSATFYEGAVAPGELVTLRGLGIGPDTGATLQLDASGHIANSLAGVQVFFDGVAAPLLYAQSGQINAQVPWELAGKSSSEVHVEYNGASSNQATIPIAAAAPGIFYVNYTSPQGAILNHDGTVNSAANPAAAGSVISIYGTGGGLTNPLDVTGGFAPRTSGKFLEQPVTVQIGGVDAEVLYAGAAPTLISGFFQVNVRVPLIQPGIESVTLSIAKVPTPSALVTVAIQ
jgi:uncharacterized protein (TIGR03437 family)